MPICDPRDIWPNGIPPGGNSNLVGGPGILITNNTSQYVTIGTGINLDLPGNYDFQKLQQKVEDLEKRLCVLTPNSQAHEKYESLKEAYEAYQIIDKLINEKKP